MAWMPGWLTSASPITLPRPITRLNTPGGMPERLMISASAQAQPGTRSAGLSTTQLPKASAGAIFHAGMAIGKFHGVIRPTTPTGSRVISTPMPGRTDGSELARQAQAFAGEELEDVAGARGLADAFGLGLAFFARQQRAELFLAREDLVADLVERVRARLDAAGGPGGKGGGGGGDGGIHLVRVALRVLAEHVGQVARVDVGAVAGAGEPFAVDEVVEVLHGDPWSRVRIARRLALGMPPLRAACGADAP